MTFVPWTSFQDWHNWWKLIIVLNWLFFFKYILRRKLGEAVSMHMAIGFNVKCLCQWVENAGSIILRSTPPPPPFLVLMLSREHYSPFNERMSKHQEHYHIHFHISASQVFKKSLLFWKIKSSVILNLDRRIRNYNRNDEKHPIYLLTWLVLATMCEQLPFPYSPCPHTHVTFWHSLVERTIVSTILHSIPPHHPTWPDANFHYAFFLRSTFLAYNPYVSMQF